VFDLDQVSRVRHHLIDVLVRVRDLVDPLLAVPVLDAPRPLGEIGCGETRSPADPLPPWASGIGATCGCTKGIEAVSFACTMALSSMCAAPSDRFSAVDHLHLQFAVVLAGRGGDLGQLVELLGGEHDSVGGDVLLDPGHSLGARDGSDVVALSQ
jgi:hypothetical protein